MFYEIRLLHSKKDALVWQNSLAVEIEEGRELLMRCSVPLFRTDKSGIRHMSGALTTELFMPWFTLWVRSIGAFKDCTALFLTPDGFDST